MKIAAEARSWAGKDACPTPSSKTLWRSGAGIPACSLASFRKLLAAGILLLSSLSAEDRARIYVYAQFESAARSWMPISCDRVVVAKVKQGRFFAVDVLPGRHVLSINAKSVPLVVEVRDGEEQFVRLGWHYELEAEPISVLQSVTRAEARREMLNLAYIEAKQALSKSVPKNDPRARPQLTPRGK